MFDLSNRKLYNWSNNKLDEITSLDISYNNLYELPEWLKYCNNLQMLYCDNNNLESLNNLPKSLKALYCSSNRITNLDLKLDLQVIHCDYNKITNISYLPPSLEEFDCSYNYLKKIDRNILPSKLQEFNCYSNRLTELPILPDSLQELGCGNNNITTLEILPEELQILYCYNNNISTLPTLPQSLQHLYCYNNQLLELPSLPHTLKELYCGYNQLTNLPVLPFQLKDLNCYRNKLTSIPDLPISLERLDCNTNELTQFPISIINCRNLIAVYYENNRIEYIPPIVRRIINRQINKKITVYNDSQSVHNHNIQESIKRSIYNILSDKIKLTKNKVLDNILADNILTQETKESLIEYSNDNTEHSVLSLTFLDLLIPIWERIEKHKDRDEIKNILNQEMNDAICKCFTGRISRLINCLNGFYSDIQIQIGDNEQIGNIIIMVKESLGENYNIDEHKKKVSQELLERGYNRAIIDEWISYI